MGKFCHNCGKETNPDQNFCLECGAKLGNNMAANSTSSEAKSKIAAGLLGIFLGSLGVHNFYLGYTSKAVAQLLITILSCGMLSFASGIWGLVEGIMILVGNINKDANGILLKD